MLPLKVQTCTIVVKTYIVSDKPTWRLWLRTLSISVSWICFYTDSDKRNIFLAMYQWENHTCVRFKPRTTEQHYVTFVPGSGWVTNSSIYSGLLVFKLGVELWKKLLVPCAMLQGLIQVPLIVTKVFVSVKCINVVPSTSLFTQHTMKNELNLLE